MSDHTTHSSNQKDTTPENKTYAGGAGGAGFDEDLVSQGVNIQRALSSAGNAPPDPKTVLQMQSTLGNRTTIQLVNKQHPKAKLQRKKKGSLPFQNLRMIQRKGGDNPKEVSEEDDLDLGEDDLKGLETIKDNGPDEQTVKKIDFSDEPMVIKGSPNGGNGIKDDPQPQDEEDGLDLDDDYDEDDYDEDGYDADDESDEDVDNPIKANVPDSGQVDAPKDDDTDVDDVDLSSDTLIKDVKLDDVGSDSDTKTEVKAPEGGSAKKDKSTAGHVGSGALAVGKGFLNATVGLGIFSAIDFWKGVLEVDKKKQEALYGDNWKAWTFLENTVNLAQAVADITTSIGFITGIAGAITSVLAPPAAPFLVTMATIAGTFATIAHIIAGVGRIVLGIKMATRLSELEPNSKEHALVKGTMIRQFVGAVANTIGAVTGGLGGAFSPAKSASEAVKGLSSASGSAWKEGGKALLTGVTNQGIGGSTGDLANATANESTEHLVDRKASPVQRALASFGIIQREGATNQEAIAAIDERIALIRKLKGNVTGGLSDMKESDALDAEKKEMRKQQLAGIQQGIPELEKLEKGNTDAKSEGEKAEAASKGMQDTINDQKPPEEKKDKSLWGRIKSAAKAAFKKLLSVFAALKKKVLGFIAKLKAKLVGFVMNLLGVAEPAKEVQQTMMDKQKELPEAMAEQDKNQQESKQVQSDIKDGLPKLEKAEKKGLEVKKMLQDQDKEQG